jgi:hypothetical protein
VGVDTDTASLELRKHEGARVIDNGLEAVPIFAVLASPRAAKATELVSADPRFETEHLVTNANVRKRGPHHDAANPILLIDNQQPHASADALTAPRVVQGLEGVVERGANWADRFPKREHSQM